ncbi:MAG: protein kinase [Anaerolineae bacterium]|nr:protein kinase [Gloeobacterales cyanobacterium ES-bin-313]
MLKLRCVSDRRPLTLNPKATLGEGGEGTVFAAGNRLAAKIYRNPSEATQRKLKAMLAKTSANSLANQDVSIAWPLDLLIDEADQIVGFLMPQALASRPIVDYYNPKTRLGFSPFFSYRDLHRTARNLAAALEKLHAQGYVVGDLNESNILVTQSAHVTLVDADSIQVIDGETLYHCRVGKAEFMPPELQGQSLSTITRTTEQDNFALAILIFQTLMEGSHPYAGIYTGEGEPPSLSARIGVGHFPYSDQPIPYRPSPLALPFTILHPKLQAFFQSCFVDSQESPQNRPTAAHWREALTIAEQDLRPCTVNPRHTYGSHLESCPWCYRKALLKDRDPFPEKQDPPKSEPVAATPKNLPMFGILSSIFLVCIIFILVIGQFVARSKTSKLDPYLLGSVKVEKLTISFCKDRNRVSFPENTNSLLFKGFATDCPPSPLKLSESIYDHIYPQGNDSSLSSQNSELVLLNHQVLSTLRGNSLSPNGLYFASIDESYGDVQLYDTRSNTVLRHLGDTDNDSDNDISAIAFSPDSTILAVGQFDGVIKFFRTDSGRLILEKRTLESYILGLNFIDHGKVLCFSGGTGTYRLMSVQTGKTIGMFGTVYDRGSGTAFSPDGNKVAIATFDHNIRIYITKTGEVVNNFMFNGQSPTVLAFSQDSHKLVVGDYVQNSKKPKVEDWVQRLSVYNVKR